MVLPSRRKLQQHRYHSHKALEKTVGKTETKVEQSQNATAFSENCAPYNINFVVKEEVLSCDETEETFTSGKNNGIVNFTPLKLSKFEG